MGHSKPIGDTPDPTDAWMATYEASADDLNRFAAMLVGRSAAGDVVADAMEAVLCRVRRRPIEPAVAYLYRAVSNTAKNQLRSTARRTKHEATAAAAAGEPVVDETEPPSDLLPLLAHLSANQRAVVFLTYWMDLTPLQVADHLDVAEGTVRSHLARARRTLRGVLDE